MFFLVSFSCTKKEPLFKTHDAIKSGIEFKNMLSETADFNILDYLYFYNGGGVAIGDINNDGLPDIYFSGNQVKNKLYLNKGDLQFEDITEVAGVAGNSHWNTGAVMGDVNGDGWLDIYVCAVVGIKGLNGYNELFINNGDGTFSEKAEEFGLNYDTYSSSAAFLDHDLDGDLDIYLLNHAVHTQESFGHANLRLDRRYETGDKLLKNDNGKFKDVSEEAGIYGGVNGYGLGVAVADFNQDGFPDLYVGNDFHEDDYFYLNNGNGTFSECLKHYFGHITRFSMGNDAADINHDGKVDFISLDMLPENEKILKSSEGDDAPNIQRLRVQRYGYHYQYSRNMLYVNQGANLFMETALLSGLAATDWSWSALFADFNQDTHQDLFISNGIPKRPNDLDYIRFVSNEHIKTKIDNTKLVDQQALELMPSGASRNYVFEGNGNLSFKDQSDHWIPQELTFSTATAWADLDNDGDLDLVINNINGSPELLINQTNKQANHLKLRFEWKDPNRFGIGTKTYAYSNGQLQFKELYTVRGFQASSEPTIHFGMGLAKTVDSIRIIWPDQTTQLLTNMPTNQTLIISPSNPKSLKKQSEKPLLFTKISNGLGISFRHQEDRYLDFDRQKLIPYRVSDRGPATAIGDLNGDDQEDLFFGGSKYVPSMVFFQQNGSFEEVKMPALSADSIKEGVAAIIEDLNQDGKNDLFVGSGGADFYRQMKPLLDSYFLQIDSGFIQAPLPNYFENASVIRVFDFDEDGNPEVFIGNQAVSNDFGRIPRSYLLESEKGTFSILKNEALSTAGMVTDAALGDFNNDGKMDLIVVGEWMPPVFYLNENGQLKKYNLVPDLNGLWQTVMPFDIDGDGDLDVALGNWGRNSKFVASRAFPLCMYYGDIDGNGSTETIVALAKNGTYYPLESLDQLAGQMVHLRKKYTSYQDFAGQTIHQIFDRQELERMELLEVHELQSGYLKNEKGSFRFYPFPIELQVAPMMAFASHDFDQDGKEELLAAGNYFGVKPFHSRFDSFSGALIHDEKNIQPGHELGLEFLNQSIRALNMIEVEDQYYLLVTIHDEKAQLYQFGN